MRLCGTRALALGQVLSSCPARTKSATGHGARLTVSAKSGPSLRGPNTGGKTLSASACVTVAQSLWWYRWPGVEKPLCVSV